MLIAVLLMTLLLAEPTYEPQSTDPPPAVCVDIDGEGGVNCYPVDPNPCKRNCE